MAACTFFGHRDTPSSVKPQVKKELLKLIDRGIKTFYVGDKGAFDLIVISLLREIKQTIPDIRYSIVLAYLPKQFDGLSSSEKPDSLYPEGIENVPPRFAISWRNRWMLQRAEYVICYVKYSWGGAAQFAELAKKQGKTVINLAEAETF